MKIAVVGPISTRSIAHLLDGDIAALPQGVTGAPFMATLIDTLIERGHEVIGITQGEGLALDLDKAVVAAGPKFRIHYAPVRRRSIRFNGRHLGRIVDGYALERRFYVKALRDEQPQVIHAHWAYESGLAAETSGFPYVLTCHDSPVQVLRYMPNLFRFGRLIMAHHAMRQAKVVTAVSGYLQTEISGYCANSSMVIPNPMPGHLVSMENRTPVLAQDLAAPRVAAVLNGWGRRKNAEKGLHAFALLRKSKPGATLHMYGFDFGPGERAEALARSRGWDGGVIFHGLTPHAQLLEDLATMHVLLHPALEECCPLSLIEAMAVGLVVVGGRKSGGVPWVLDGGRAGALADVTSAQDMARVMLELLSDPVRHGELMQAGQERARRVFDPHVVAAAYEHAYGIARQSWGAQA
jgi:glycosyltransferase involved in cell wall biosynthesis